MKGAMISLVLLCLVTGCASEHAWSPVEADQGLVYGSSCRPVAERWPAASPQNYAGEFNFSDMTQAVNEHQKWESKGKRVLFDPWVGRPVE